MSLARCRGRRCPVARHGDQRPSRWAFSYRSTVYRALAPRPPDRARPLPCTLRVSLREPPASKSRPPGRPTTSRQSLEPSGSPTLEDMTIQRMDHVGVVVGDLAAATAFFVELGLELEALPAR